jgi:hypothetical protein
MAETSNNIAPTGPTGGPAVQPRIGPWLLMYTVGRLGIFALLTLLLWWAGMDLWSGLLFGLLLSMPASYLLLRPSRERLSEGLAARRVSRQATKADLRARLSGDEPDS